MTHDDTFLADILADPPDDAPRLIYADYLEDTGRPQHGEFIRVQCEIARLAMPGDLSPGCSCRRYGCRACETIGPLRRRERELLARDFRDWFPPVWPEIVGAQTRWRRGFVESVTMSADAFVKHAAALFAAAPILEVTLAGKAPWRRDPEVWGWYAGKDAPALVPSAVWERIAGPNRWTNCFPTRAAALAALSRACVDWGRERAGLPALAPESGPAFRGVSS